MVIPVCNHEFTVKCQDNGLYEVCNMCGYIKVIKLKEVYDRKKR